MAAEYFDVGGVAVPVSNLDKVLWPGEGITKAELIRYYVLVSGVMLPYLTDRPITVRRYPDGITGQSFYQKQCPSYAPPWVRRAAVAVADAASRRGGASPVPSPDIVNMPASLERASPNGHKEKEYVVCDSVQTLVWLAGQAALEIHHPMSRVATPEHADWCVFDLDPSPPAGFAAAAAVCLALGELLEGLGVRSAVKTSGADGLHVYVPMPPGSTFDDARELAERVGRAFARAYPDRVTVERDKRLRAGRVYLDYLQNGRGRTMVAPYSVRPLPGAPVSAPVTWLELRGLTDPRLLNIRTVPRRVPPAGRGPDPFARVLPLPPQRP